MVPSVELALSLAIIAGPHFQGGEKNPLMVPSVILALSPAIVTGPLF